MRILITGAGGMLGLDLQAAARTAAHDTIALTRADLDITDAAAVRVAIADARPDVVIGCAAWTDVDGAETEPQAARAVNGDGAGHVAAAAAACGAWTIHVSSDYVFDGSKRSPYLESDRVSPLSEYGRSKLAGERAVAEQAPDAHTIVRTAWLFGAHGRCFPKTMLRLAGERDELAVVSDQVGSPTFTGHLAAALVGLAEQRERTLGIVHLAASGECSWCEFARAIIAAGPGAATTRVRPITTAEYPTPARRPAYSVLRSERGAPILPSWQDGLRSFITELAEVAA
ncbi:MAG TPA: dTDP-4-dehydrorhamnose reductase [Solirubrobacteraceae bacterium]|nr:dTDP-4-dehydrorhamnose reductase [Solirubrobacteraceae bacterium]